MTAKEALEFAKKNKVEIVDLKFIDLPGLWQHFSISTSELTDEQIGRASCRERVYVLV